MDPHELALRHYWRSGRVVSATVRAVLAQWATVSPADLSGSWATANQQATQSLALGQFQAAGIAADYVLAQSLTQGGDGATSGVLDPRAFAGIAADGRPLLSLLNVGVIEAKVGIARGLGLDQSMTRGAAALTLVTENEVQQAGRNADHVAITAAPDVTGYVRMTRPPSCSRCIVLAGKFYKWNSGFRRHPRCDCVHVPAADSVNVTDDRTDPRRTFDAMTTAEQDKTFGKANAQAIREGSDIGQVVNTSRKESGLYDFQTADGTTLQATREGTNVNQGRFGRTQGERSGQTDAAARRARGLNPTPDIFERTDVARLTPKSIYKLAGDDRARALDLLRRYGYLT